MHKTCYGIIPARYDSTRLPGKPLADIAGKPMFWHVYDRARRCPRLSEVWVATDDQRIMDAASALGVPCLMTARDHPSGTDRVHEAARKRNAGPDAIIVNIQGDEPFLEPGMMDEILDPFFGEGAGPVCAVTLATPLDPENPDDRALIASPDQVKVVTALNGDALYFSRSPVPFARDSASAPCYAGHIGIYAFRADILERFTSLPPSPLEKLEKLEQLRLLENGIPLRVVTSKYRPHGVDTPEDLAAARAVPASSGNAETEHAPSGARRGRNGPHKDSTHFLSWDVSLCRN